MITDPSAAQSATPATTPASQTTASASSALTSDFDTFLKMLTAQAKYQDPLEPLDSTEYAAQLAQFSMVEQQVQTNDILSALSAKLGGGDAASLAAWVGMEARAITPVQFTGAPITVSPAPASAADQAILVVYDSRGIEVQRLTIEPTNAPVIWSGLDGTGAPFPVDAYRFEVESLENGAVLQSDPAAAYSQVIEAQIDGGEVSLVLEGGQRIAADAVTALRGPS